MGRGLSGSVHLMPFKAKPAVCAECGKTFSCPDGTRYTREINHRRVVYCSHRCFRVIERQEEAEVRARIAAQEEMLRKREEYVKGLALAKQERKKEVESAKARVRTCERKLDEWTRTRDKLPRCRKRSNAQQNVHLWGIKLIQAKEQLKKLEEDKHGSIC